MTLSCRLLGVRVEASRIPSGFGPTVWQVIQTDNDGVPLQVRVGEGHGAYARLVTLGPGNWAGLASALGAMYQHLANPYPIYSTRGKRWAQRHRGPSLARAGGAA